MKFGVNILNFGAGTDPTVLRRWALTAEELGYHFLMVSDHVAITEDVQARYPVPFYDPFITLAWLSGIVSVVELGTTVTILPYRHPLQTARMAANLDQLCGGRFILGVGVGWAEREFEALGVPFARRGAIADECLSAIRDSWGKEVASREGEFFSFRGIHTAPSPARLPHPPIWVGGSSEQALRRAVLHGDAWHPIHSRIAWLQDNGVPRLRALADAEGRRVPDFCPRIDLQITESRLDDHTRFAGQGTLGQIRDDLEALESLGARYVLFDTYGGDPAARREPETDWHMLASIAERVIDLRHQRLR